MINLKKIGAKLKQAREDEGYTNQELADALGIRLSYLFTLQSGNNKMNFDLFMRWCKYCGVDAVELFEECCE